MPSSRIIGTHVTGLRKYVGSTIASKINVTPKGVRLSEKLQHSVMMKFDRSNKFDLAMLLWASKFAMVKIECSFEMGK